LKILEKFEAIPSTKFKIPGHPAIDVPMTGSDGKGKSVIFETSVILEQKNEMMQALEQARKDPHRV
jgi:hypothetical protein